LVESGIASEGGCTTEGFFSAPASSPLLQAIIIVVKKRKAGIRNFRVITIGLSTKPDRIMT
jgi:hypothetical protein